MIRMDELESPILLIVVFIVFRVDDSVLKTRLTVALFKCIYGQFNGHNHFDLLWRFLSKMQMK